MDMREVYRTKSWNNVEVLLLFKPEAFLMMEADHQEPLEMTIQIARNATGIPGPWSPAERITLDIESLGKPHIDDAAPHIAGKLWIR